MTRIVHMTSVHPYDDIRIFQKMCTSLANAGYDAHIVAPIDREEDIQSMTRVKVHRVPKPKSRWERFRRTRKQVMQEALNLKADIYHFHDPELLPIGLKIQKILKVPVIYDVHEDVRLQVLNKEWIKPWARKIVGKLFGRYEDNIAMQLAGIVSATPSISQRFSGHRNSIIVQNFALLNEFIRDETGNNSKRNICVYAGTISKERGVVQIIEAVSRAEPETKLLLAGNMASNELYHELKKMNEWKHVDYKGLVTRNDIAKYYSQALVGMIMFHPLPNHMNAQPNKLFEYMGAGLPVIVSDFPSWREIVSRLKCGILVDPLDTRSITQAVEYLLTHPEEAEEMGQRGKRAVEEQYNWSREEKKLFSFYESISIN